MHVLPYSVYNVCAVNDKNWTKVVQAVFKRQAGLPFAPKDLRSSFVTFLLSDGNSDEALKKAVAQAMRHSTAQQTSSAYDKEGTERNWAAAVRVADAYASRFEYRSARERGP